LHLVRSGITPDVASVPNEALDSFAPTLTPGIASMKLCLDGEDVGLLIRDDSIADAASVFSSKPEVRKVLLEVQREAVRGKRVIAEGRDMGTVVFPRAAVKFFLIADLDQRSRRRHLELLDLGKSCNLPEIRLAMRARDERDTSRKEAPLSCPPGGLLIDTTRYTPEQVVDRMVVEIRKRVSGITSETFSKRKD
ncbi:MAG: (d)CMP kinase, partial [Pseudomonadota bacterium]